DALEAADAPGLVDNRLAGLVHLDAVDRTDALAPCSAGDALPFDELRFAAGFLYWFYWFSHGKSFKNLFLTQRAQRIRKVRKGKPTIINFGIFYHLAFLASLPSKICL